MIAPTFRQFRNRFAVTSYSTGSFAFVAATRQITRASGDFTTDGVLAGMLVDVSGAGSAANNARFTVESVAAGAITLVAGTVLANDPATAGVVVQGAFYDYDGLETWPVANLRAGGFDGGFTVGTGDDGSTPITAYTLGVTIIVKPTGYTADATKGADEYDWFVSQQSDDSASQLWTIDQRADSATQSFSGMLHMTSSAVATTEFPGVTTCTPDVTAMLFKNVHVYCQRRSDKSIQWIDLLSEMLP